MRRTYLNSLEKVRDQKVDIFLGNHCINNNTLERHRLHVQNPADNPFVDEIAWGEYLDKMKVEMISFMSDPANN